MEAMGTFLSPSSCTKMGRMKLAGETKFSRIADLKVSLRRFLRGLAGRSCMAGTCGSGGGRVGWA
jgi:hypothetical protein